MSVPPNAPAERKAVTFLAADLPKLVLSGPASKRTTFALHVTGPVDRKELENIIEVIKLQVTFLENTEPE